MCNKDNAWRHFNQTKQKEEEEENMHIHFECQFGWGFFYSSKLTTHSNRNSNSILFRIRMYFSYIINKNAYSPFHYPVLARSLPITVAMSVWPVCASSARKISTCGVTRVRIDGGKLFSAQTHIRTHART